MLALSSRGLYPQSPQDPTAWTSAGCKSNYNPKGNTLGTGVVLVHIGQRQEGQKFKTSKVVVAHDLSQHSEGEGIDRGRWIAGIATKSTTGFAFAHLQIW